MIAFERACSLTKRFQCVADRRSGLLRARPEACLMRTARARVVNVMTRTVLIGFAVVVLAGGAMARAQNRRVASPPGASATQIGGTYDVRTGYVDGKWLEVRYGRPIKRGRDLFGTADYVDFLNDGAPVWRAGANQTTRLNTEVGDRDRRQDHRARASTRLFIDLQPDAWMLVVSTLAGADDLQRREQAGAVGRLRLHARPRCREGAHDA